jgi:hypothetical protein
MSNDGRCFVDGLCVAKTRERFPNAKKILDYERV